MIGRPPIYLGREYDDQCIEDALRESTGIRYRRSGDIVSDTADLLADENIVGWFQGRSEFGPRALGNRSILASPRFRGTKYRINSDIKHREFFRPLAPSVLQEYQLDFFAHEKPSFFMTEAAVMTDRSSAAAVKHEDGTARYHTVSSAHNELFHSLIDAFRVRTGLPILLNTSFNDREPIVESPIDALSCFKKTNLDYLIVGPFIVERLNSGTPQ